MTDEIPNFNTLEEVYQDYRDTVLNAFKLTEEEHRREKTAYYAGMLGMYTFYLQLMRKYSNDSSKVKQHLKFELELAEDLFALADALVTYPRKGTDE